MDPQKALEDMLKAVLAEDIETAADSLDHLIVWARNGGFIPDLAKALAKLRDA